MVLAEENPLLWIFSRKDNFYLLFQKLWVFSLWVPLHQQLIFDLWEEIKLMH